MSAAIIAEGITKRYHLGQLNRSQMFRDTLANLIRRPFARSEDEQRSILALDDVSFEVEQGEVIGIVGRNGAGKSTLLKVLSKITFPSSGRMHVRGRAASLLEVGTGFHEELTGRENIFLNGSILGMKKREIDRKLDAIVAFADVERFLDTPIKRYSSGMRLRLGFAVAAHLEPDVLMVDEVLAVGDVGFQKKCLRAMDDLNAGGRTVLFVSHNLAAVENLCPRTIWIDEGKVREDGETSSVIQTYLSTFAEANAYSLDLRDVQPRRGTGEVRFTRIEFLDVDRNPVSVVRTGGELVIRLHYEAAVLVQEPHFGIEVHTNLGTLITSINTWTTGFHKGTLPPGDGVVEVHVHSLPLVPDRYYLSLWSSSVGMQHDRLDLCAALDIEAADVQRSGRELDRCFGIVYLPCTWGGEENRQFTTRAGAGQGE